MLRLWGVIHAIVLFLLGCGFCGKIPFNWAEFSPFLTSAPSYMFLYSQFYDVSDITKLADRLSSDSSRDLGGSFLHHWVSCLGDFTNDRRTDWLVVGCDDSCLYLLHWDHVNWQWHPRSTPVVQLDSSRRITYVAAGDINYDGFLDLLVHHVSSDDELTPNMRVNVTIWLNDHDGLFHNVSSYLDDLLIRDQVLLIDSNSNYRLDLFGVSVDGQRGYWKSKKSENPSDPISFTFVNQTTTTVELKPIRIPHTSAWVDLNGDCAADLFVVSCVGDGNDTCTYPTFEIWENAAGMLVTKKRNQFPAPRGTQRVSFSDIDRDGNLDLVFPVCFPPGECTETNEIVVWYNRQERLCKSQFVKKGFCRSQSNLCVESADYQIGTMGQTSWSSTEDKSALLVVEWETRLDLGDEEIVHLNADGVAQVAIGDFNLDGYPDLFVIVRNRETGETRVRVFRNDPCSAGPQCSPVALASGLRMFTEITKGIEELAAVDCPDSIFFFDIDEMGHVDIVLQTHCPESGNRTVLLFYNNFYNDAFFLKTFHLNGSPQHGKSLPLSYGAYYPGSLMKWTIHDDKGYLTANVGSLMSSQTHLAVPTPYVVQGTGRTPDYVQNFFYAVPVTKGKHDNYQQGLVPNSQIIAIPIDWRLELFQVPSKHAFWVAVSVFTTLVLLGVPIILCSLWECIRARRENLKKPKEDVYIG